MQKPLSPQERKLAELLLDFDYKVEGKLIIQLGVRGFSSDKLFGTCRDLFDAAEQLIPLIRDDNYSDRLNKLNQE